MTARNGANTAISECMKAKKDEEVLIVTDTDKEEIGRLLYDAAKNNDTEPLLIKMEPREHNGEEPPSSIAEAMASADVVLAPTSKSLTHTRAREEACNAGARVATLPGITKDMMCSGGMTADYQNIQERAEAIAEEVKGGLKAVIKSPNGTKLKLDISDRTWHKDIGICENPGEYTNLPAGEIFIAPRSADGKLVVDGSMAGIGVLESPLEFEINQGEVINIEGDRAKELENLINEAGNSGRNVAELGIGLNPAAELIGKTLEDEKVGGTIHIAIGDNSTFGGSVESEIHLDGIVTASPQLFVDEKKVELPKG